MVRDILGKKLYLKLKLLNKTKIIIINVKSVRIKRTLRWRNDANNTNFIVKIRRIKKKNRRLYDKKRRVLPKLNYQKQR